MNREIFGATPGCQSAHLRRACKFLITGQVKTIGETPMFFPAPEAGFFCGIFAEKIHRHNKVPSYRAVWDEMFFSVSKVCKFGAI